MQSLCATVILGKSFNLPKPQGYSVASFFFLICKIKIITVLHLKDAQGLNTVSCLEFRAVPGLQQDSANQSSSTRGRPGPPASEPRGGACNRYPCLPPTPDPLGQKLGPRPGVPLSTSTARVIPQCSDPSGLPQQMQFSLGTGAGVPNTKNVRG